MSAPFIVMSTSKIKNGRLDEYRKYMIESVAIIHADEPRMIAFSTYVNEDGTKVTTIQVHPDADSMMFHMQLMRERFKVGFEHLEIESMTFYGKLNDQILEMAKQIAGSGVAVNINEEVLDGFFRSTAN